MQIGKDVRLIKSVKSKDRIGEIREDYNHLAITIKYGGKNLERFCFLAIRGQSPNSYANRICTLKR